jgi:hypothetical protein
MIENKSESNDIIMASAAVLRGLIVGLPGARRRALEIVLGNLETELERLGQDFGFKADQIRRLWEENEEHSTALDAAKVDITRLKLEIESLRSQTGNWLLEVRKDFLMEQKIRCIHLLRVVTGLDLKDAKDAIELIQNHNRDLNFEWVLLAAKVSGEKAMLLREDHRYDLNQSNIRLR